jgi:3-oxoacyl-(acyl-carrier-protein) synthase
MQETMTQNDSIVITGAGLVSAYGIGNRVFSEAYNRKESGIKPLNFPGNAFYSGKHAAHLDPFEFETVLGKKGNRTLDRLTLLVLTAVELLLRESGFSGEEGNKHAFSDEATGIILGTTGPIKSIFDFEVESARNPEFVLPGHFPNTVFCASASYAAIRRSIKGSGITIVNGETSSLAAVAMAIDHLSLGISSQVILGGAEELTEVYAGCVQKISGQRGFKNPILGEGAALFTMEKGSTAKERGVAPLAEVLGVSSVYCPERSRGYARNLENLEARCGAEALASVSHVFSGQKADVDERAPLRTENPPELHRLYPKFGFLGPLTGSMAIAAALADRGIAPGSHVLINNFDLSGNCSSLVLRKLGNLA